jgi:hypothetical protein
MVNLGSQVVEILKAGRERITNGWCKGRFTYINSEGVQCYCALGALGYRSPCDYDKNSDHLMRLATLSLYDVIPNETREKLKANYTNLHHPTRSPEIMVALLNNDAATTKTMIIDLFNEAIARYDHVAVPKVSEPGFIEPSSWSAEPDDYVVSEPGHKHLTSAEKVQLALKGEI